MQSHIDLLVDGRVVVPTAERRNSAPYCTGWRVSSPDGSTHILHSPQMQHAQGDHCHCDAVRGYICASCWQPGDPLWPARGGSCRRAQPAAAAQPAERPRLIEKTASWRTRVGQGGCTFMPGLGSADIARAGFCMPSNFADDRRPRLKREGSHGAAAA